MKPSGAPSDSQLTQEFRILSQQYADLVRQSGIEVVPFLDPALPILNSRSVEVQHGAVESIRIDIDIFQSMLREGFSLRDSAHHLWRYIRAMGAIPDSSLFDKIGSTDIVEMYALDQRGHSQVFRNLRYLECVSFTLEQLFGMDWRVALERKPEDVQVMEDFAAKLITGECKMTMVLKDIVQIVLEVGSAMLYEFSLRWKCLSPVRKGGQFYGAVTVLDCESRNR